MQVREAQTSFAMRKKGEDLPDDEFLEGGDYPRSKVVEVGGFQTPVTNPVAFLAGFDVEFEPDHNGEGRPLGNLDVRVSVDEVFDDTVTVKVVFGLRDWSNDWDDEHKGTVRFTVLAD